jgi:hypothetical protein
VHRYRYQLEAFVDKLRGRDPEHWFDAQDSITNLEWIEAVYKEVGHNIISLVPTAFQFVYYISRTSGALTHVPFLSQTGLGSRPPSTAEVPGPPTTAT